MNAITQYIDLYKQAHPRIEAGSAPLLGSLRPEALRVLESSPLPEAGSENFEHTDLEAILAPDFGLNIDRRPLGINPADTFSCHVPNMSTALFFLAGDSFAATPISRNNLPQGVTVTSLRHAALTNPGLLEPYYGKIADITNPLVALNSLLAQDGLFLYVPKGVKVERPIQLVNMLQGAVPMMAVRRLLIVLEEDAEACLLCCDHTQNSELKFLNLQTVEIHCGPRARFDMYELEESSRLTSRLSSLYLDIDNYSLVRHDCPHCSSNQLFKYVVDDRAVGAFTGRVYVAPGAVKTEALQANRNLVASPQARMFSKPQLEIYADDVKCSHGTAIGQLDPMQIFYMRTRGLSEAVAKTLLRQAFMADVIAPVRLERLRDRLRHLVDLRLSDGYESANCSSCASAADDCSVLME